MFRLRQRNRFCSFLICLLLFFSERLREERAIEERSLHFHACCLLPETGEAAFLPDILLYLNFPLSFSLPFPSSSILMTERDVFCRALTHVSSSCWPRYIVSPAHPVPKCTMRKGNARTQKCHACKAMPPAQAKCKQAARQCVRCAPPPACARATVRSCGACVPPGNHPSILLLHRPSFFLLPSSPLYMLFAALLLLRSEQAGQR